MHCSADRSVSRGSRPVHGLTPSEVQEETEAASGHGAQPTELPPQARLFGTFKTAEWTGVRGSLGQVVRVPTETVTLAREAPTQPERWVADASHW